MGRVRSPQFCFHLLILKERFKKGFPCFEAILKTTDVRLHSHTDEETGQHDGRRVWVAAGRTGERPPLCWQNKHCPCPALLQFFRDHHPPTQGQLRHTLSFLLKGQRRVCKIGKCVRSGQGGTFLDLTPVWIHHGTWSNPCLVKFPCLNEKKSVLRLPQCWYENLIHLFLYSLFHSVST